MSTSQVTEGYIDFKVPSAGKPCQTWYKVVGNLKSRSRPVVILHGGPGMAHLYLRAYGDLATKYSIPVILYDQLGCGNSTLIPEKAGDGTFWNDQLFLDELDNLLEFFGILGDYDLLGHSWGGMLAARHAVRQPKGLRQLIISSSPASMVLWDEAQWDLRLKLPLDIQSILSNHEREGTTESAEYQTAVKAFHLRFQCKIIPMPQDLVDMSDVAAKDSTVVMTMYGPDEFHTLGTLKDWSIIDDIHKINVPTLLINGWDDTAQDKVMIPFFKTIQKVKWVQFPTASHTAHLEDRERVMEVVGDFLMRGY
ncbi:hypothetical protein M422DRAFT_172122 [Sphaerobolus stellatus SS14]|uniref:AB hydrolase-1 domain-containing protein n=1 Tax=Sphaerobolus stellatus (strain SS14) TaxID=990650 RepID=A0A0C9V3J4_SPHS4|nr:hypothetical protein M422DRAFT_172122 [Sphaerobolus stellatus SS14]